jgi:internalin A
MRVWLPLFLICVFGLSLFGCRPPREPNNVSTKRNAVASGADTEPNDGVPPPKAEDVAAAVARVEALGGTIQKDGSGNVVGMRIPVPDMANNDPAANDKDLATFAKVTTLTNVFVGSTNVTDAGLKHIATLPRLKSLAIVSADISSESLKCLKDKTMLESLDLRECMRIDDDGLKHLKGLTNLKALKLKCTAPGDKGLMHLSALSDLKVLLYEQTQVTNEGLATLKCFSNLEEFSLLENYTVTDEGLKHLLPLKNLRRLSLRYTPITNEGLATVGELPHLEKLNLAQNNEIGDEGLKHIAGLTKLKWLNLWESGITNDGLKHLADMQDLVWLDLHNTRINDDGVDHLLALPQLEELNLQQTDIEGAGIAKLAGLKNLERLNLAVLSFGDDEAIDKLQEALPDCEIVRYTTEQ